MQQPVGTSSRFGRLPGSQSLVADNEIHPSLLHAQYGSISNVATLTFSPKVTFNPLIVTMAAFFQGRFRSGMLATALIRLYGEDVKTTRLQHAS